MLMDISVSLLYLGVAPNTAVQSSIVTSYSIRVNERLGKQWSFTEVKIIVNWVFVDFTYEMKTIHL